MSVTSVNIAEVTTDVSSRCLVGVCVLTTQQEITVKSVPRSTMIVPGGLPMAAAGTRIHARVSDHQQDCMTVRSLGYNLVDKDMAKVLMVYRGVYVDLQRFKYLVPIKLNLRIKSKLIRTK